LTLLVTGANGFVGRAICERALASGTAVRGAVRVADRAVLRGVEQVVAGDLAIAADRSALMRGVEVLVHTAGRVHQMRDTAQDPLAAHRAVNVEATVRLAREAATQGVRRFVYLSSVKVHGETRSTAYREGDPPRPADPYALSKWEAEQALHRLSAEIGLEVVVVRPPLVYGPGVGANFLRLMHLVARGVPLPFGAVQNRRSLVFVGNLADAVVACGTHPAAAGKTYLVSDGADLSTPELVRAIAEALGRSARLVPVPPGAIRLAARLVGKGPSADRLLGSLLVDSSAIRRDLGWSPPSSPAEGLEATVHWYLAGRST
jgi:nucleoside-diphosphate-sugar epimerase